MRGKLRRADVESFCALALQRGGDLAMELDAREPPDTLVEHLAVQRVPEHIARFGGRAVGREGKVLQPTLAACHLCARFGERHRIDVERRAPPWTALNCTPHTLAASRSDRCSGVELLDVALDHARERVRDGHGGEPRVRIIGRRGRATRSSITPATKSGRPSVRSCKARTSAGSAASDGTRAATYSPTSATVKSSSGSSAPRPCRRNSCRTVASGWSGRDQLRHAKAAEPQQPRPRAAAREVVDELHRRVVTPVQVLGDQQQRAFFRVAIEELPHLAQHPRLPGAGQLAPQGLALFRRGEPRQLEEPGRRDRADQVDERGIATRQVGERLQDRQVRLAGTVLLDAVPVRAVDLADLAHEAVDDGGLAHAGFAGQPDDLASARPCRGPCGLQPREHVGAADRGRRGRRDRPVQRCRRAEDFGGDGGFRDLAQRADEPIAAARHRLDVARLLGVVLQRGAQIADRRLQHRLADELVAPHVVEQRALGDERVRCAGQGTKKGKRLGREVHRLAAIDEARLGFIDLEAVEPDSERRRNGRRARRHGCPHAPWSWLCGSARFARAERTHSQSSSGGTGLGRKQRTPALRARRRVASSA